MELLRRLRLRLRLREVRSLGE